MFPESHSASFALLAYASAYLKVRYVAAFTCALLNCRPMGFYSPATIVKDAQRHGLRILPIDITRSDWDCTLEKNEGALTMRLGLRYVRGLRKMAGLAVVAERMQRPYASISDLTTRVAELNPSELRKLASVGALNFISTAGGVRLHRRDALWQVQKHGTRAPKLLKGVLEHDEASPPEVMDREERLVADYQGRGLTTGPHPMAYLRAELRQMGIVSSRELKKLPNNSPVTIAGCVVTRQRPGTAKGLVFMTAEDEQGQANIVVMPDVYRANPMTVTTERFVKIHGTVENHDGVVHVNAKCILPLQVTAAGPPSHDFH